MISIKLLPSRSFFFYMDTRSSVLVTTVSTDTVWFWGKLHHFHFMTWFSLFAEPFDKLWLLVCLFLGFKFIPWPITDLSG